MPELHKRFLETDHPDEHTISPNLSEIQSTEHLVESLFEDPSSEPYFNSSEEQIITKADPKIHEDNTEKLEELVHEIPEDPAFDASAVIEIEEKAKNGLNDPALEELSKRLKGYRVSLKEQNG